jgi:hypothetical protein
MGKVLKTILIIFVVLILILAGVGIYLYEFYVFKTFRICVSNEAENLQVECQTDDECFNILSEHSQDLADVMEAIERFPGFIREKYSEITDEAVYCESSCRVKRIYGDFTGQQIDACAAGDKEIEINIRGKEALELAKFVKENSEIRAEFGS